MAAPDDVFLAERHLLIGCNLDLFLHDVDAGDELSHRMLNLHAGVHFDEKEFAVFVQKFKRARAAIVDSLARLYTALANFCDQFFRNARRGAFFDNFLVAALHGAVALEKVHRVFVLIGEDLYLDVARVLKEFLHVHRAVTERRERFAFGQRHRIDKGGFGLHHAHAASTATA